MCIHQYLAAVYIVGYSAMIPGAQIGVTTQIPPTSFVAWNCQRHGPGLFFWPMWCLLEEYVDHQSSLSLQSPPYEMFMMMCP